MAMTGILKLRERRFRALHAFLTGEARTERLNRHNLTAHLSQDLGLPETIQHERPVSHLGIFVDLARP